MRMPGCAVQTDLKRRKAEGMPLLYPCVTVLSALYFLGIVWINLDGRPWYNHDIYADAMVAKTMFEERSVFPESWVFGNQLYVIATPVLASFLYGLCRDSVVALGIASCLMTIFTLASFLWCVWPFCAKDSKQFGLLCLIGGTLIGNSASSEIAGLQIFYTMASYYACYMIGIFLTIGAWLRLFNGQQLHGLLYGLIFAVNFALGMQSLREMLVLNIPLCVVSLLVILPRGKTPKKTQCLRSTRFAAAMFAGNLAGTILARILQSRLPIQQADMLSGVGTSLVENVKNSFFAFLEFAGLFPVWKTGFGLFRFGVAVFTAGLVLYALIRIFCLRRKDPLSCMILFCVISLAAVFCAGVLVITVRSIYYFVWHLLVALSFIYAVESLRGHPKVRNGLLMVLLVIGTVNLWLQFGSDIRNYPSDGGEKYKKVAEELRDEGITHVYFDAFTVYDASQIAAYSKDEVVFAAIILNQYVPDMDNLLTKVRFLYSKKWFDPKNLLDSYIMLSEETLQALSAEWLSEYRAAVFSNLTFERQIALNNREYYLYSFTETLFQDMICS